MVRPSRRGRLAVCEFDLCRPIVAITSDPQDNGTSPEGLRSTCLSMSNVIQGNSAELV